MSNATAILDSRFSWTRLMITLLAGTIGNAGMWTVIVILPQMEVAFGLERSAASLIFVATMLGFAVGNVITGKMSDRFGVVPTLLFAAAMAGFGHVIAAFAPNAYVVGLAQAMIGLGTAASFSPLMADISHWFLKRRGIAMSIAASANYLSGVVWPLILNWWLPAYGWQWAYAGVGICTLVLLPPLTMLLRTRVPDSIRQASDLAANSRSGSLGLSPNALTILLGISGIACCVAMSMPQVHIVALCIDLGYGPAVGAEMLSLMLVGGVFSRLAGGMISDRIGGLRTLLLYAMMQLIALCLYIPFDGPVSLYLVSFVFGLSQGGLIPAYAVIVREYLPAKVAGARVGLVMMATILGMALGGWMSGWIHDVTLSYTPAFINGMAFNLIAIIVAGSLLWRASRQLQFAAQAGKSGPTL